MSSAVTSAAAELAELNAHLDLTEKEREFMLSRKRQLRMKNKQMRKESDPDLMLSDESGSSNRFMNDSSGQDENRPAGRVYTGDGFIQLPNQRPAHIQRYTTTYN